MQKWHEYHNYKRLKNDDGTITYIIMVDGVDVEVNEEIYRIYAKFSRKMRYMELDLKNDRVLQNADGKAVLGKDGLPIILPEREISLDKLCEEDWHFPSPSLTPEEVYFAHEYSDETKLRRCIRLLNYDEQALIEALYFAGLTERGYAEILGISKTALHARKLKALRKIKSLMIL